MIGLTQFSWILIGAGLVLLVEMVGWFYWRKGSNRECVSEEEEPRGEYQIIKRIKTPNQHIALVESNGETWIYANGDVMFSTTEDENMYAEAIIHVPMEQLVKKRKSSSLGAEGA